MYNEGEEFEGRQAKGNNKGVLSIGERKIIKGYWWGKKLTNLISLISYSIQ